MPLIADYIAINNQLYGFAVMLIVFILSLLGCLLLAIGVIKLIIWCFFGDRLFCLSFTNNKATTNDKTVANNSKDNKTYNKLSVNGISVPSMSEEGMLQTVTTLENILLQLSKTNVTINRNAKDAKNVCTCPHCENKHRPKIESESDYNYTKLIKNQKSAINAGIRKGNYKLKKTGQLENNVHSDNLNSVVSRLVLPIVSHRQSIGAFNVKSNSSDEIERYNSYGDVLLELKQKFASNNAINSIA